MAIFLYFMAIILIIFSIVFPFTGSEFAFIMSPVILGEAIIILALYKLINIFDKK